MGDKCKLVGTGKPKYYPYKKPIIVSTPAKEGDWMYSINEGEECRRYFVGLCTMLKDRPFLCSVKNKEDCSSWKEVKDD